MPDEEQTVDYNLLDVWERFLTFQGSCDLGRRATLRAEQPRHRVGWCMSALAGNTCLNMAGVVSTMKTPSRTSFKRFLPFCSVGFHREAFNSTIHHLLTLKRCKTHAHSTVWSGSLHHTNGPRLVFLCTYVAPLLSVHWFPLILGSRSMELRWLWNQVMD